MLNLIKWVLAIIAVVLAAVFLTYLDVRKEQKQMDVIPSAQTESGFIEINSQMTVTRIVEWERTPDVDGNTIKEFIVYVTDEHGVERSGGYYTHGAFKLGDQVIATLGVTINYDTNLLVVHWTRINFKLKEMPIE